MCDLSVYPPYPSSVLNPRPLFHHHRVSSKQPLTKLADRSSLQGVPPSDRSPRPPGVSLPFLPFRLGPSTPHLSLEYTVALQRVIEELSEVLSFVTSRLQTPEIPSPKSDRFRLSTTLVKTPNMFRPRFTDL